MSVRTTNQILLNNDYDLHEDIEKNRVNKVPELKKKKSWKHKVKIILIIIFILMFIGSVGLFLFFKTGLFQEYKELWVQTAMTTMNHQYLATWFMSDTEINEIMKSLEVVNNEDSELNAIELPKVEEVKEDEKPKENQINVDKISGSTYVGYVMTISDPSKVKFVDSRKANMGTKLSEICKKHNAIAGINAGGFTDPNGGGMGHQLCEPTIIDKKLLYGNRSQKMSLIALTERGELVLGKYTYQEAMDIGIQSGLQFGPFIIVNGEASEVLGNGGWGVAPRTVIGQRADGIVLFFVSDGRSGLKQGIDMNDEIEIMQRYEAINAANLDGGTSSVMIVEGEMINDPIDSTGAHKTRWISTGFYLESDN